MGKILAPLFQQNAKGWTNLRLNAQVMHWEQKGDIIQVNLKPLPGETWEVRVGQERINEVEGGFWLQLRAGSVTEIKAKSDRGEYVLRGEHAGVVLWEKTRDERTLALDASALHASFAEVKKNRNGKGVSLRPDKRKQRWKMSRNGIFFHKKGGWYDLSQGDEGRFRFELVSAPKKTVFISYVEKETRTVKFSACTQHERIFEHLSSIFPGTDTEFVPENHTNSFDLIVPNETKTGGVLVEIDGSDYHTKPEQIFNDLQKNTVAKSLGFGIVRLRLGSFGDQLLPKIGNLDVQARWYDDNVLAQLSESIRHAMA